MVADQSTLAKWRIGALIVFALTVAQLAVAAFVPGLEQFEGKAFAARLVVYPAMMLVVPGVFTWWGRRQPDVIATPWDAYALTWAPFLIDVTGNTLDLYDSIGWWDDANHLVNWFLLSAGLGLAISRSSISPPWALGWVTAGLGAILAIAWEVGEWATFIRFGTELATAYEDTLLDQVLGALGAGLAGVVVYWLARRRQR